jgi:hypothetical protein
MGLDTNDLDTRSLSLKDELAIERRMEKHFNDTMDIVNDSIELIQAAQNKDWSYQDKMSRIKSCFQEALEDINYWEELYG